MDTVQSTAVHVSATMAEWRRKGAPTVLIRQESTRTYPTLVVWGPLLHMCRQLTLWDHMPLPIILEVTILEVARLHVKIIAFDE